MAVGAKESVVEFWANEAVHKYWIEEVAACLVAVAEHVPGHEIFCGMTEKQCFAAGTRLAQSSPLAGNPAATSGARETLERWHFVC